MSVSRATAFAPASVGNAAVGFDILGFAVGALGDRVSVTRNAALGIRVVRTSGAASVPVDPAQNTAGVAVAAMAKSLGLPFGFDIEIEKGIPLGSGLGGSAASAVAAVVAANAVLDVKCDDLALLKFAMQGEAVASGSMHADNVAPSLLGGLVLTVGGEQPLPPKRIPTPPGVRAVIAHPHMFLATKVARSVLRREVTLADFVQASANLAGVIAGCYTNDIELLRACLEDVVIEPQRQSLIPGFAEARAGALRAGAIGCSISGAGPATFAWALDADVDGVRDALCEAFTARGMAVDSWVVGLDGEGAHLIGVG